MLGRKTRSKNHSPHVFLRFIRSVLSIVVLTALVLGVTLGAKELYAVDAMKFGKITSNLLAKLHVTVDEQKAGEIAGKFAERISQTNLGSGVSTSRPEDPSDKSVYAAKSLALEVAVLSDIHEDTVNLDKALEKIKQRGVKTVFVLGDLTGFGDVETLEKIKNVFDNSGLTYFVIPGDHDIAQSLNYDNFTQVFGTDYGKVELLGYTFGYFGNAANYTPVSTQTVSWLEGEVKNIDFLLTSQPLYVEGLNPPFNSIFMGSTSETPADPDLEEKQEVVRDQGKFILNLIRENSNVKAVIAGDHHKSSSLQDANRSSLMHYVVGAVSSTLNEYPQKVLQSSRFSVLSIFQDGSYEVSDVVLD